MPSASADGLEAFKTHPALSDPSQRLSHVLQTRNQKRHWFLSLRSRVLEQVP